MALCPRAATRRSGPPSAFMPSSCPAAAFTTPRHENRRSWLYRMRPTADHRPFTRLRRRDRCSRRDGQGAARAQPAALGPARGPSRGQGLRRRHGDDARQPRSCGPRGRGGPSLPRIEEHGAAGVRRCGRRDADRSAARRASNRDRARDRRARAGVGRAGAAGGEVPRGGRARGARLCRGKPRPSVPPSRAWADREQRPRQCARFRNSRRLVRGQGRADRSHPEVARLAVDDDASTIRRSTSSRGTATMCRGATSWRAST